MKPVAALTVRSNGGLLPILSSDVNVATPSAGAGLTRQQLPYRAIWDTGATGSVITPKVVSDLHLAPSGVTVAQTANGPRNSNVYLIDMELPNGVRIPNMLVTDGDIFQFDVLIGMDIITLGDFSVTNSNGVTVMSFRLPSIREVDFVKEVETQNKLAGTSRQDRRAAVLAARKAQKKGRP